MAVHYPQVGFYIEMYIPSAPEMSRASGNLFVVGDVQPKKLFPAPFEFFLPLFPSPSHHRAVEHTLTHEVIVHTRVSLLCQGLSIKAWVNDRLKYKWKFLEIFQTDIASVDPSSWIAKISVEVENCVHHQSSKAS